MGADYVRLAKINVGATRRVKSKITGRMYRKRINATGKLRDSFNFEVDETSGDESVVIKAVDYAQEVSDGTPRRASSSSLATWIRSKPVRLRNANGQFIEMTQARVASFANFIAWKVGHIGSDFTGYLDGIQEKVSDKYSQELEDAIAADVAQNLADILDNLPNTEATT